MHDKPARDTPPSIDFSSHATFKAALLQFANCDLFQDTDSWSREDRPYERELRPQDLKHLHFDQPINIHQFLDYQSMAGHRLLLTIYESDFLLLPRMGMKDQYENFRTFYCPERRALGQIVRPGLERHLFGFLEEEIDVSGKWTEHELSEYFTRYMRECADSVPLATIEALGKSKNLERSLHFLAIQLAGDFLLESSAMARNVAGRFGQEQSELFKILIDEYGYGVHGRKHSTLYEKLLDGLGLTQDVHDHWQFYLTSSLALNNYYNYLSANHALYFRYLGATVQTETAFIPYCRQMTDLLRDYSPGLDRSYFSEHAHIDTHHSSMAYERLVKPTIALHGPQIIPEIIRGFEGARLLSGLADKDFAQQIQWMDDCELYKALHPPIYERLGNAGFPVPKHVHTETQHQLSVTHVHDADELCHVDRGVLRLAHGKGSHVTLNEGEGTIIRKGRLHGAVIPSADCAYTTYTLGDHTQWL
ncbi:iron-containing redox enzyme family protein [Bordetella sp. N]|uniref:iron-containing redox enzyme family protein n=1 Tax=Bordetella sp. N TaxID=1746199 RepID=UPI000708977C|nr:iron-containing redox enzyme family protein [Bordetella sp. N]ALM83495.1 hypothetical protein ASB57_11395 [Bordetella sp. N]